MSEERVAVDERSLLYGPEGEQHVDHSMSNGDAVSLFNTSLSKALERQQSAIIETLSEKLGKSTSSTSSSVGGSECTPYEFKHEGYKIQFNFNQERFGKLTEIEDAVRSSHVAKVFEIIAEQKVALTQRNKILKIADRHGWDTVNEYLDDPLADNNDDAIKLRYAVNRATRKRNYRYRPYDRRRAGMFSPSAFFRGFGRAGGAPGSATGFRFLGQEFMSGVGAIPRDRNCYYCRQPGHIVGDCPLTRGQAVPTPASATVAASSSQ